jgi:hypothetical protein
VDQQAARGRITPDEVNDFRSYLTNAVLHAAGIIDYRTNYTPKVNYESLGLGEDIYDFVTRVQRNTLPTIRRHGRPPAVRSLRADMGSVSARPEELAKHLVSQEGNDSGRGGGDRAQEAEGREVGDKPPEGFAETPRSAWQDPTHPASFSIRRKIADLIGSEGLLTAKETLQDFNARVEASGR